jgi:hypothetical protein
MILLDLLPPLPETCLTTSSYLMVASVNTSGNAGVQILHLTHTHYTTVCNKSLTATYQRTTSNGKYKITC